MRCTAAPAKRRHEWGDRNPLAACWAALCSDGPACERDGALGSEWLEARKDHPAADRRDQQELPPGFCKPGGLRLPGQVGRTASGFPEGWRCALQTSWCPACATCRRRRRRGIMGEPMTKVAGACLGGRSLPLLSFGLDMTNAVPCGIILREDKDAKTSMEREGWKVCSGNGIMECGGACACFLR